MISSFAARTLPFVALFSLLPIGSASARLHTETVEYKDGDAVLSGYLAYDDAAAGKQPGVVVVHDWLGLSADTERRADMLAGLGYVAFAADIYGKGVRPKDARAAGALAGRWKADRPALRRRARAALDRLLLDPHVDTNRVAAMGYCFGGTTALELARSGAPPVGTVTFHAGLDTPNPADARNIHGHVLALHGGDDPNVPPEQVQAFEREMREAHVDWQLYAYGGAVHSFTIKGAGTDNSKGAAYNERADRRSWEAMKQFFTEVFAKS